MARIIEVVACQERWPLAFEADASALRAVFGGRVDAVHHVGSTAVPGLAAKPIIDVLVVLDATHDIDRFSPAMQALGYRVRGERLDAEIPGTPGRFYFSKAEGDMRTHHVHVCAYAHPQVQELLRFRDFLRAYPHVAQQYGERKGGAARANRETSIGYMRAKADFMTRTVAEAHAWANAREAQLPP